MGTSRARAGHARHTRTGFLTRALAALAVAATAAGTIVATQVTTPEAAQAAQEPAAAGIEVGPVRASMGTGIVNESETDTTTSLPDNFIRYGIVPGMSETPFSRAGINGGKPITDNKPVGTQLGGTFAKNNDLWTYITRGHPWKWDTQGGTPTPGTSEAWMNDHGKMWDNGGDAKLWANGQSAIGFKPNDPGTVQPGETFLLGAIRHNNLPIRGGKNVKQFLHSSLNITLPDLLGGTPESFPFVNQETYNTLSSTIIYRKGGAYVKTEAQRGTGTCSTYFGINGWPANQQLNGKWPRDLVLDGSYGVPKYTDNGEFIGPAYEPDLVDASDPSKGYVNKPESQSGRYYCVKYVGEGNGDYDLYSQYYNAGAGQPYSTLDTNKPEILPRTWPGAKGNVNENPYVWDNVKLQKTTSDQTFTKNGRTYRLQLWGFTPANNPRTLITSDNINSIPTADCPATPPADAKRTDTFVTQELSVNYGCLYGVITEERSVRIVKSVEDPSGMYPAIPAATFAVETGDNWHDNTDRTPATTGTVTVTKPTASSAPAKTSYISAADPVASLTPTGFGAANAKYDSTFIPFEVGNSDFTITEKDISTGGDDLVVHGEAGGTVGTAVHLDGLRDAQVGGLVLVDERTGDGGCLVGRCAADVLEVDAALGLGHGDVFTDAVDTLDVLEVPLVVAAGVDLLLRDGEVGVADLEGDERRVVLRLARTKGGGGQRRERVGGGHVGGARRGGRGRGGRDGHGAGGRRGAVGVIRPGGAGRHREVGGGDRRVGTRRVLDGLRDAHGTLLGDDTVEAGVVNREFLRHEVVGALGVSRRGRRAVGRRDGVEVLRGQEVGRIRRRGESPQLQAVGAAVLREGTVRDGLLQLNGVGDVGVLVDVTLRARPGARRDLFLHELVVRLLCTAVVVLAVQVVVTVALAHVLDAVHASGARFGLVDVTLRAIRRVNRVRLIGGTDEGARGRVTGTTVGTIEDQVTDPPSTD